MARTGVSLYRGPKPTREDTSNEAHALERDRRRRRDSGDRRGAAAASMMTTHAQANLSGIGDHGTASLTVNSDTKKLCWKFTLPMVKDVTGASIHSGRDGMKLLELGMHHAATGCASASAMTLEHLAATPKKYYVWVDVKGQMGDLRGQLIAGM
jgi:CHRD domain